MLYFEARCIIADFIKYNGKSFFTILISNIIVEQDEGQGGSAERGGRESEQQVGSR